MKYLSLFSGIEAATQAWEPLGWEAVAYSEIEPFPCAVLNYHYPNTPNLGDITKITESQIKKLGQIDLIAFGSPCQDLSVAGKRKGLEGERSGLFTTAIKIIKWARKHGGARYALWENVPGAFSSNGGKDFAEVIRLLSGAQLSCEKWSASGVAIGKESLVEWRVLDAQHFGVPQRRRRIFALADFGDWSDRQPILFESESVPRDIKESKKSEQGFTRVAGTLTANGGGLNRPAGNANELDFCIPTPFDKQSLSKFGDGVKSSTLSARDYKSATDLICLPTNDKATRYAGKTGKGSDNGLGVGIDGDPCPTLTTGDKHTVAYSIQGSMIGRSDTARPQGSGFGEGAAFTLNTVDRHAIAHKMQVRRLTPTECERLQGFPDGFTKIPYKNKETENCPDSPRYKALGNSMAVPVMKWIGERIGGAFP